MAQQGFAQQLFIIRGLAGEEPAGRGKNISHSRIRLWLESLLAVFGADLVSLDHARKNDLQTVLESARHMGRIHVTRIGDAGGKKRGFPDG